MERWVALGLAVIFLIAGFLEIFLSLGLFFKRTRKNAGLLSAMYFILILPAHLHVSLNEIPMFGISSPWVLWGRTLFQSVFIYGGYRVGRYSN